MWIYRLVWTVIVTVNQFNVQAVDVATSCAYKDDSYKLNKTSHAAANADQFYQYLVQEMNSTRGVKKNVFNGYEQCEDSLGTSHCYTLWQNPKSSNELPVIIKQGCWINLSQDASLDGCQATKCRFSTSDSTTIAELNYCCCTGNKCNDVKSGGATVTETMDNSDTGRTHELQTDTKKTDEGEMLCAYRSPHHVAGKMSSSQNTESVVIQGDKLMIRCVAGSNFCFSYYQLDPMNKSRINIQYQGCWNDVDDKKSCESSQCIPYEKNHYSHRQTNNSYFCCCYGNLCNNNVSTEIVPFNKTSTTEPTGPVLRPMRDPTYRERTIIISLLSVFSVAVIILATYFVYRCCFQPQHVPVLTTNATEEEPEPTFDIDKLKISCQITKGRYSEVWKGSLNEQDVAVKIYTPSYKQYYYNEKYIYSLPFMEHENVLKFIGGEERILQDGTVQHLLVLEYIPDGTLLNYLKNNTFDWFTMCKLCHTLARGMSHLHTEQGSGDIFKPTVGHRDLNSRNVLVRQDLSCVIADLGFCTSAKGSNVILKGRVENAEQTSLTDIGTLRYMAPELLDGAVNLRDCEASLKHIDIYALGLVLWEISSRCADLYQGCPMPEFALPYQHEAGNHPTFEEMQLLVSRNKVRPKFPEVWKEYNQTIRVLKETIEECWDQDAEARLTTICVEERIAELKALWCHDNRNKANKGVTPTINTALLSHANTNSRPGYHGNGNTQWGGLSSASESTAPNIAADGNTSALIRNDIHNSTGGISGMSLSESTSVLPQSWSGDRHGSFSTSTMETTVAVTPGEPLVAPPSHPKSQNINLLMNQPVPRHQGRNPIVERNTHKRSDEELAVVGNNLIYSRGDPQQNCPTDSIFDNFTESLESSLMQHDSLNQNQSLATTQTHNQRNHNLAPTTTELRRKVINNPEELGVNAARGLANGVNHTKDSRNSYISRSSKKVKEIGFLGQLALFGRLAFGGKFEVKKHSSDGENVSCMENGRVGEIVGRQNPIFEPSHVFETEVRLTGSGAVVRPAGYQAASSNSSAMDGIRLTNLEHEAQRRSVEVDPHVESSDPEPQSDSPLITRHRVAPYSKSTSDLSPQKLSLSSKFEDDMKLQRPSTLSLRGHNYSQASNGSLTSLSKLKGIVKQKGITKRTSLNGYTMIDKSRREGFSKDSNNSVEKLGVHERSSSGKNARFSLHDDRLMTDSSKNLGGKNIANDEVNCKPSASLQHFNVIEENTQTWADCAS
ncbi:bone morphogenetic protein receptor type-2-like isoform X2 [Dreissena polymorpha]|nr:bone morphogenetic protein receptor type-2-like isoform X2 [Dreissena polymorpha]